MSTSLHHGDCIEVMATLEAASVSAIVCDPPYGIAFMGSAWDTFDPTTMEGRVGRRNGNGPPSDSRAGRSKGRTRSAFANPAGEAGRYDFSLRGARGFQVWCEQWGTAALRVLKPGGYLLAFGGTRTYHRLGGGIEDAGFEIRDCVAWLFGQGFPKSLNLGDGRGTALKPAHEPIVVARKPLVGTVAGNVAEHGAGALNIDGCRIEHVTVNGGNLADNPHLRQSIKNTGSAFGANQVAGVHDGGRWPANVVLDEEAAAMLDAASGSRPSGSRPSGSRPSGSFGAAGSGVFGQYGERHTAAIEGSDGGASRFFYCAKTSRAERNAGLDGFERTKRSDDCFGSIQTPKLDRAAPRENWQPHESANHHPTVKPIALMRWLVRLVSPSGGLILDPFLGSGTTGIAARLEGFPFVGIEREDDYVQIAEARIAFWEEHGEDGLRIVAERDAAERKRADIEAAGQLDLLAESGAA